MTDDQSKQLLRAVESLSGKMERLDEKLDGHSKETRDRWEVHEKDHRAHDKEHSELYQREVRREERLAEGSKTMRAQEKQYEALDIKVEERTKSAGPWAIAAVVVLGLGLPALSVIWIVDRFDSKADKNIVARVDTKADIADVKAMSAKIDSLTISVTRIADKLQLQTEGP